MDTSRVRNRLRRLREEHNWSQVELANQLAFKDRQTISAIENGERKISADELVKIADLFGVELEFFFDPFRLYGEADFSWRQKNVLESHLNKFEEKAGQFIGLYRWLLAEKNDHTNVLHQSLYLNENSLFEDATLAGEELAYRFTQASLPPAQSLQKYVEEQLGMLVLYVDAISGISGAACRLPQLGTILVNRRENEGRRHFDIAHELFHLLTWDTMEPRRIDSEHPSGIKDKRIENLADSFASGILMPLIALQPFIEKRDDMDIHTWLNTTASALHVSAQALKFRVKGMNVFKRAELDAVSDAKLKNNGATKPAMDNVPPLFSHKFLSLLAWGLDDGRLSVRRAASLLGISIDQLATTFSEHDIACPFEL